MESRDILSAVVANLYQKAADPNFTLPLNIKVVSSAEVARTIFLEPDTFIKNYGFIEGFARGRFSANGEDWRLRSKLTQSFYSQATVVIDGPATEAIYSKHLQAYLASGQKSLFDAFINAALEVVSNAFALPQPIAWPMALVHRARAALADQQAIAWIGASPEEVAQSQQELDQIFAEFSLLWERDSAIKNLLNQLSAQADGVKNFNAVGELLQNIFASTETTASGLLWAVECMTRYAHLPLVAEPEGHAQDRAYFLDEVLRVLSPVPYVSRVCTKATKINGMAFAEHEAIIVSLIGVHSDPQHWHEPLVFKPRRDEFVNASYARHAFIPFISGPRVCAGMKLAKQEIQCGVQALLKLFVVKPCTEPRGLEYGLASRPSINLTPYLQPRLKKEQ